MPSLPSKGVLVPGGKVVLVSDVTTDWTNIGSGDPANCDFFPII
jgi:hypothetical protein